jgi:hypothetical protein
MLSASTLPSVLGVPTRELSCAHAGGLFTAELLVEPLEKRLHPVFEVRTLLDPVPLSTQLFGAAICATAAQTI